jgi:hypothetical protein
MALVQVSTNSINKANQTGDGITNGNTGDNFVTTFNDVLKIPANSQIALCQGTFQLRNNQGVHLTGNKTENRKIPGYTVMFGGGQGDPIDTFFDGMKIAIEGKNFSAVTIPLGFYASQAEYPKVSNFWNKTAEYLGLHPSPQIQGVFVSSSAASSVGVISQQLSGTYNLFSKADGVDATVFLPTSCGFLTNSVADSEGNITPAMVGEDDGNIEALEQVAMFPIPGGTSTIITGFQHRRHDGGGAGFFAPENTTAAVVSKMNGFHDADGHIQSGGFAGENVRRTGALENYAKENASKRCATFGVSKWVSPYRRGNYELLIGKINDPIWLEAMRNEPELNPYLYAYYLIGKGVVNIANVCEYFFLVCPKIDEQSSLDGIDFHFYDVKTIGGSAVACGAAQCINICCVERGRFMDSCGDDGTNFTYANGFGGRFCVIATGDKRVNEIFGIPYSGYLDTENISLTTDTATEQALRFVDQTQANQPDFVKNMGYYSCFDDDDNTFIDSIDDAAVMHGLEVMNSAYRIKFFRRGQNGDSEEFGTPNLVQVTAVRDHNDWITNNATKAFNVIGYISQACYPLQFKASLTRVNDFISKIKFIPANQAIDPTPCDDLLLENNVTYAGMSAYWTKNMIIPAPIMNKAYADDITPVINYYPLPTGDVAFVSENRHPPEEVVLSTTNATTGDTEKRIKANVVITLGEKDTLQTVGQIPDEETVDNDNNPFIIPNIDRGLYFTRTNGIRPYWLLNAFNSDQQLAYKTFSGTYVVNQYADPMAAGLYVHLMDLPNFSVMGSMKQVNTKMVGLINNYDRIYELGDEVSSLANKFSLSRSVMFNQQFPIYVDLRNPAVIETNQLRFQITDRFGTLIGSDNISNVQMVFHIRDKVDEQILPMEFNNVKKIF